MRRAVCVFFLLAAWTAQAAPADGPKLSAEEMARIAKLPEQELVRMLRVGDTIR